MTMICGGCGWTVPEDATRPFSCGAGHTDVDHVLARVGGRAEIDDDPNPFIRFRRFTHTWQTAMARGIRDDEFVDVVHRLGDGFHITPFTFRDDLGVWVKDETNNVAGSHKSRHLFGVMLWLELMARFDRGLAEVPLAIASCGNAAFAAATIAKAAGRKLDVYVPVDAKTDRIEALGARVIRCRRVEGVAGDPAVLRFREAVRDGALPFTCQGNENGLAIEGGSTLAWEMATQHPHIDRVFIQTGGGALASAIIAGFRDFGRLPAIHAVQTQASPLARAWQRLQSHTIDYAARHRSEFMWPWETAPVSVATGIVDDETYDWLAVVRGMRDSGGWPVVVSEEQLIDANVRANANVSMTGSAGLAGALANPASGATAVLFTGAAVFPPTQRSESRVDEAASPVSLRS
jgi:threonine synthase